MTNPTRTGPFRALAGAFPLAGITLDPDPGTGGTGDSDADQDDDSDADDDQGDDDDDDDPAGADKLGDAGKQALARMKDERRAARAEVRKLRALLTPEQLAALGGKAPPKAAAGAETDPERIRADARTEARLEANRERVADKIEAKARGFADPEDAVAILLRTHDVDDYLDSDGKVDSEQIAEDLAELLEKKPHLAAATAQGGRRFQGGGDQGTRNGGRGGPAQLTHADVKKMSPEAIVKAREEGKLDRLLGIK